MRDVARQKLNARRAAAGGPQVDQPKYRDRASERRVLFNQPDVPLPEKDAQAGKVGKRRPDALDPIPLPPKPALNPGQDDSNIGNKLLKMMGWKEGTGLGSTGEGRTEPMLVFYSPHDAFAHVVHLEKLLFTLKASVLEPVKEKMWKSTPKGIPAMCPWYKIRLVFPSSKVKFAADSTYVG